MVEDKFNNYLRKPKQQDDQKTHPPNQQTQKKLEDLRKKDEERRKQYEERRKQDEERRKQDDERRKQDEECQKLEKTRDVILDTISVIESQIIEQQDEIANYDDLCVAAQDVSVTEYVVLECEKVNKIINNFKTLKCNEEKNLREVQEKLNSVRNQKGGNLLSYNHFDIYIRNKKNYIALRM
jgi:hypothetical protein